MISYQRYDTISKLIPSFVTATNKLLAISADDDKSDHIQKAAHLAWKKLTKYHELATSDACVIPLSTYYLNLSFLTQLLS